MNKILFISPCKTSAIADAGEPVQKLRTNMSLPGVVILGALKAAGFETHFLDLTTEDWYHQRIVGKRLMAYGLSSNNTLERIREINPNFILITSMFTFEFMMVDELVKEIKKSFPGIYVILGGVHATAKPEWHFEESDPDFIVIGEGEETIVELLTELSQPNPDPAKISGVAFSSNTGEIVNTHKNPLLSDLSSPWAFDKIICRPDGAQRYIEGMARKNPVYVDAKVGEDVFTASLYGSRGCINSCQYCMTSYNSGNNIRHIGSERMFKQFLTLRNSYNISVFCNQADTFGYHSEDRKFLNMVKAYRHSTEDTSFVINNPNAFFLEELFTNSRKSEVNYEFLKLLKDAGFNIVTIAIETVNQRFNAKINWKKIKQEMVYELCRTIREMNMKTDIYMMYGFPGETSDEFKLDLKFGKKLKPIADLISWFSLSLLPGTYYYDKYVYKTNKEKLYRKIIRDGYGFYFMNNEFNLSEIDSMYFQDALNEFGKSWI